MHKIFCTSTVVLHLFPSPQKPPKLPSIPMGFLHIPTNFNQTHPHPVQDFQKDSKEIFGYCQSNAPSNAIRTSNMKYKLINGSSNIIILFYFRCADVHTSEIHTHTRLIALCPGLPGWASTRKVKLIWILLKHPLGHMQVCTSLQSDNHASTPPLSFYRPDALPVAQPTASKHWMLR